MKKILVTLISLTIANFIFADIKYDPSTKKFHSIPASKSVNLDEYNALVEQMQFIERQCWNSGVYGKKVRDQIFSYLMLLKTPTSLRLLSDLKKAWLVEEQEIIKNGKPSPGDTPRLQGAVLYIDMTLLPKGCASKYHSYGSRHVSGCGNKSCTACYVLKSVELTKAYKELVELQEFHAKKLNDYDQKIATLEESIQKANSDSKRPLREKINSLHRECAEFETEFGKKFDPFSQTFDKINKKLLNIGQNIAKEMGASCLVQIQSHVHSYVDTEYDITQLAIDRLNEEYNK